MSRRPFFKFYGDDFFSGCAKGGLTLEEIGLYVAVLHLIWDRGDDAAADPKALSVLTGADQRKVKFVLGRLVEKGKVQVVEGMLRNARMTAEITRYTEASKAAREREEAKRKQHADNTPAASIATPGSTSGGLGGGSSGGSSAHLSKKTSEINEGAARDGARSRSATRSSDISGGRKEDRSHFKTPLGDTGNVPGPSGPSGLFDLGGEVDPVRVNGSKVYVTVGERTEAIPKQAMRDIGWRAGKLSGDDAIAVGVSILWRWVEDGQMPDKPTRALEGWMRNEIKREAEREAKRRAEPDDVDRMIRQIVGRGGAVA